jgi:hypothetical protein
VISKSTKEQWSIGIKYVKQAHRSPNLSSVPALISTIAPPHDHRSCTASCIVRGPGNLKKILDTYNEHPKATWQWWNSAIQILLLRMRVKLWINRRRLFNRLIYTEGTVSDFAAVKSYMGSPSHYSIPYNRLELNDYGTYATLVKTSVMLFRCVFF